MTRTTNGHAAVLCTLLLAATWASSADEALTAEKVMEQRVQPCIVCHGKEGRATPDGYYPRIAGKPAGYLLNELINFRDGRRAFPQMVYFTQLRTEVDLAEIVGVTPLDLMMSVEARCRHVATALILRWMNFAACTFT